LVKVILQLYPLIRAESEQQRMEMRPLGRNSELYQQTLDGWMEIIKAADDMGLWGVSTIEHHFHSEGYEVGPNPGVLDAYWAAITKNVRVGALGYVMSAQDPIRVAEEAAILDHLTKGRYFVGFARGYQARWTHILGQHLGTRATLSPHGASEATKQALGAEKLAQQIEDDRINRDVFEEQVDMVLDAWGSESIAHQSPRWQVPPDGGIEWPMTATGTMGAQGEYGPDGKVHRVAVVPAPYTKPHPPIFIASNASRETVEYAGRKGFIPTYFSPISRVGEYGQAYVDHAKQAGYNFALGQNQAIVRWPQVGKTREDAMRAVAEYDVDIYKNFYTALTPMRVDPNNPVQSVLESGLWAAGTVDEVKDQFVEEWKIVPAEYCVLIYHYAQQPKESVIWNLEQFMTKIKPALDELTEYSRPQVAAG
jgi:alkanesulfonate monooxygenase SsuD/methylene tetrahydromethanopterin reductase-like flavin-dependent oxidoreductase (luciferase family)